MRELHLFAGIGGGILAGQLLGHRCVGAVEINPYCQEVLRARQADGVLPAFPIHADVTSFDARPWRGQVDVVAGGPPCQPWSVAGKRRGVDDPRHLWPHMARVVGECRPQFVFVENTALAAFQEPKRDLEAMGYRVPPALRLGAADFGAPHRRNRWWLLAADADREVGGFTRDAIAESGGEPISAGSQEPRRCSGDVSDPDRSRLEVGRVQPSDPRQELASAFRSGALADHDGLRQLQPGRGQCEEWRRISDRSWWESEPDVRRVAHGIPARIQRLRALGNAQVPIVAATAFRILMGLAEHSVS